VGILLRLRGPELSPVPVGEDLGENPGESDGRKGDGEGEGRIVPRHRPERHRRTIGDREPVEPVPREGGHDLPHPVAPVIHAEDGVAAADRSERGSLGVGQHDGEDELVGLAAGVGVVDGCDGVGRGHSPSVHQGVPRLPGPVPAMVPVHGEVPAGEGCDHGTRSGDPLEIVSQGVHHAGGRFRR